MSERKLRTPKEKKTKEKGRAKILPHKDEEKKAKMPAPERKRYRWLLARLVTVGLDPHLHLKNARYAPAAIPDGAWLQA
jgi:hypothetical protein